MRGQPFKELAIIAVLFIALLLPMLKLTGQTRRAATLEPEEEQDIAILRDSWVSFRFAHLPERCELTVNGIKLWTVIQPGEVQFDRAIPLSIEFNRVDIHVVATWPEGTPETVCELTIEPDGLDTKSLSFWSEVLLDEIYSFNWDDS